MNATFERAAARQWGESGVEQIIKVTTEDDTLPEVLTATRPSGFETDEYLADRPAIDAVKDKESVQYVLTNRKQGVVIRSGTTRHVIPDKRYRTVVVVTDKRVIALVGKVGGDERFTLDISEIATVSTTTERRSGQLAIERADGPTWVIHTEADGLAAVADYLRSRCETCREPGRVRTATQSIRGLFGATVGSAKSLERDRVAKMIPALNESPLKRAEKTGIPSSGLKKPSAGTPSQTDSKASDTGATEATDKPDTETAIDDILQALAKTDWTARGAQSESPFDLLAERADELVGVVVHCPEDDRVGRNAIKRCDAITGAAGTDTVMLATTGTVRHTDARLAADCGVRLRNVETLSDTTDPPTIEAVAEMVSTVLRKSGWSVRAEASGPFDMLADHGDDLMGIVVHGPEDGTVRRSIEHCDVISGAAGTDTVMLATTGTVQEADERLADELDVRLVKSDSLGQRHVTKIVQE